MKDTERGGRGYTAARGSPLRRGEWASSVIALAGAWLVVEAAWFDLLPANAWNDAVVGGLLMALGGYNFYLRANGRAGSIATAAVAALLGLWLVASPWVYGLGNAGLVTVVGFWNDVVVGLLVLALGAYSVYETGDEVLAAVTT